MINLWWGFRGIWKNDLKECVTFHHVVAVSLLFKICQVHCIQLKGTGCPSWTQTSSTGHWALSRFSHTSPWPTELTLRLESHLGMWAGSVSLSSPFDLDLPGAVTAGWVGGFNNVNTCLLEWARVNNLIWRGHHEIYVRVLRISDFITTRKGKNLILRIYCSSLQIIAPVSPLMSNCSSEASWRESYSTSDTHRDGVWYALSACSASWLSPGLSWSGWPGLPFTCSVALTFILTFQTNFKLLVHPW